MDENSQTTDTGKDTPQASSTEDLLSVSTSHSQQQTIPTTPGKNSQSGEPLAKKAGYAPIKKEFLLPDYKPSLSSDYISSEMKAKMSADKNAGLSTPSTNTGENENDVLDEESEPPHKKAKLKGRNKQRPRSERIEAKDKMCPAIKENRECRFGDNCKFNHDKADFMTKKLPELKGSCHLYDTFGYCQYGITCRFASNHLSDNFQNMVKEDLYEQTKSEKKFLNELDSETRQKLWKKKYNFKQADTVVKTVQKNFRGWGDGARPEKNNGKDTSNLGPKDGEGSIEPNVNTSADKAGNLKAESSKAENKAEPVCAVQEADTASTTSAVCAIQEADAASTTSDAGLQILNFDESSKRYLGAITDEEVIRSRPEEMKKIDLQNKLYLAPLTTVGNLPFRRICKGLGAEVTCGEMALVTQLLKAKQSEWSLIKRHPCEDIFGVQVCGSYPDTMTRCAQLLTETCNVDFIDINCGCPIDLIYQKGGGSALMGKATKLEQICRSMIGAMGATPLTVKLRKGVFDDRNVAHQIIPRLRDAGVSLVTVHGRSREQRYTRQADWDYISQCAAAGAPMPVFGNGDILSYEEANLHMQTHGVSGVMLARGALIKPWLFTEIKEQRHWDISAGERLDILRDFSNFGLEHWGSDFQGVENTRKFLLEWLSFLHRYIPVGVLERVPQHINERPPYYVGRNDLETLMASANCADWIKISEMLLGPVPPSFRFLPKHKANAYQ